ncbi:2-dehydro-3-deoxygalactonokinase [Pseudohoeflea suaedae]|uniref:2-dehydro-3-deoxygalactonokinase n=1 Tax=Pseudohoeflea suaedae TaxID=877384 RepID=A0A4R5PL32_9HYPH|nr:2-dehydro-3-deoxygalactonokinase [Pseudohoeflea suaedae]TDH37636.1 2-dehydro-3-deoxygalactonokinase [Pseudohoeflea suaedae]
MTASTTSHALDWIAVDWGTTSLRAWAVAADGSVIAQASSDKGMGKIGRADYEPALLELVGPWIEGASGSIPVIVCGMAGARQGWKEAAYRSVPCQPVAGEALTPVETADRRLTVGIVPGLCQAKPEDVMRGEETQLAGLLAGRAIEDASVCLPGTHSKWVSIDAGRVARFTTVMTGELFALIGGQSILRHSVGGSGDREPGPGFLDAVDQAIADPASLTSSLFSIRARSLLAEASPEDGSDILSGLLIGTEIAACRPYWQDRPVHLIGAGPLVARYAAALQRAGARTIVEDGSGLTLAGLARVRAGMKEIAA